MIKTILSVIMLIFANILMLYIRDNYDVDLGSVAMSILLWKLISE